jgi:adenylate kinase family enzyme
LVAPHIAQEGWTLDGNYKRLRDLVWGRADTLIWLDYPMSVTFMRVLRRTLSRSVRGTTLWAGNRESLWLTFCSRDSILLWVIQTWRRHRREYPEMLAEQRARGKRVLRFRSPGETAAWLGQVGECAESAERAGASSPRTPRAVYPSSAAAASSSVSRELGNST